MHWYILCLKHAIVHEKKDTISVERERLFIYTRPLHHSNHIHHFPFHAMSCHRFHVYQNHQIHQIHKIHSTTMPIPHAADPSNIAQTLQDSTKLALLLLGATLSSTPDWPEAVAVHCSPHAYPLGQQFPPASAAQLYHALGQLPALVVAASSAPVGATMTTPLVFTMVSVGRAQEPVVWQSRPTRQQPEG
jgi:hypothetical protein